MRTPPVVINDDQVAELISNSEIAWQKDIGSAIVTQLRHRERGDILLHNDAFGASYYVEL